MKRIYLSLLITLSCVPIFSQMALQPNQSYLREGWQGAICGGAGFSFEGSMAMTVDGELGKHITPKLYIGGGITVGYSEAMSMGLYVSPRYYYSRELNSLYVEASLGLTLLGGKFNEEDLLFGGYYYDKSDGPTTGIAVGYVFDKRFSIELGVDGFAMKNYHGDESSDGSINVYSNSNSGGHLMLKVNYTFGLDGKRQASFNLN